MMSSSGKKYLLIVDDEETNREFLARNLQAEGYHTLEAKNGNEALQLIDKFPNSIAAILLDLIMPILDGYEFLSQVKTKKQLNYIPIIIQTSKNTPTDIESCIKSGAFYYLAKPYEMPVMKAIIKAAIDDYSLKGNLNNTIENQNKVNHLLSSGIFEFKTPDDVTLLAAFLSNIPNVPEDTRMGLSELMLNAVEHGNLEISYEEKGELIEKNRWLDEIKHRLNLPEYKDRTAQVSFSKNEGKISFTIVDQGNGFEWKQYEKMNPERMYHTHGRGIAIASSFSFEKLEYHGKGNSVTAQSKLIDENLN